MRKPLLAVMLAALLIMSGCASGPAAVNTEELTSIRRIAVVSMAADVLTRQHVGVTVFGNEDEVMSIRAWGLDDGFANTVGDSVRSLGRFEEVVVLPGDNDALRKALLGDAPLARPNLIAAPAALAALAASRQVDALLLLVRATERDTFSALSRTGIHGLGIYTSSIHGNSSLHMAARLAVFDGKSGRLLAALPLRPKPVGSTFERMALAALVATSNKPPNVLLDKEITRKPFAALTEAERATIRTEAAQLVTREAVDETVTRLLAPTH